MKDEVKAMVAEVYPPQRSRRGLSHLVRPMKSPSICLLAALQLSSLSLIGQESPTPGASISQQQSSASSGASAQVAPPRDGAHDFDFLIGNWKAHVRRLPDRLVGSTTWVEYDGISNHKKILDTNANFEEFEVDNPGKHLHIKGQTLRLYNPDSHQWSIYTLDLDKGALNQPPVVGQFTGNRGEFYDQEQYKGRSILVRYVWLNISPKSAQMEQSFSPDGGKTWETNWICELTR
jgi:hypothetical protein